MELVSKKEPATVTSSGVRLETLISGVSVRQAVTHIDGRGELSEIYSDQWQISASPISYVYTAMVRPEHTKGWVYHKHQSDRLAIISGFIKFILWDPREDSPTYNEVNEIYLSERNRGLLIIPPLVVHAVQNIGLVDAYFVNLPTVPYNHADPDKYRVDPDHVPYDLKRNHDW